MTISEPDSPDYASSALHHHQQQLSRSPPSPLLFTNAPPPALQQQQPTQPLQQVHKLAPVLRVPAHAHAHAAAAANQRALKPLDPSQLNLRQQQHASSSAAGASTSAGSLHSLSLAPLAMNPGASKSPSASPLLSAAKPTRPQRERSIQFEFTVDEMIADLDSTGPKFVYSYNIPPAVLAELDKSK